MEVSGSEDTAGQPPHGPNSSSTLRNQNTSYSKAGQRCHDNRANSWRDFSLICFVRPCESECVRAAGGAWSWGRCLSGPRGHTSLQEESGNQVKVMGAPGSRASPWWPEPSHPQPCFPGTLPRAPGAQGLPCTSSVPTDDQTGTQGHMIAGCNPPTLSAPYHLQGPDCLPPTGGGQGRVGQG